MLEEAEKGNGDLGSAADTPDHHGIWVEVLKEVLTTAFVLGRSFFLLICRKTVVSWPAWAVRSGGRQLRPPAACPAAASKRSGRYSAGCGGLCGGRRSGWRAERARPC